MNVCYCLNGIPAIACTTDNNNECEACDHNGYTLNVVTKACDTNICTCANGIPQIDQYCEDHNSEDCSSCLGNFHEEIQIDDDSRFIGTIQNVLLAHKTVCLANKCRCSNGIPVPDSDCTEHEANQCQTCDLGIFNVRSGYHLTEGIGSNCEMNQCHCSMGIPSETCQNHGGFECQSCTNIGFTFNSTTTRCDTNICYCDNGLAYDADECEDHASEDCHVCQGNFHLESYTDSNSRWLEVYTNDHEVKSTCEPNECICQHGIAVDNADCVADGQIQCASCSNGYYMSNEVCFLKECTCSNGLKATGTSCPTHETHRCTSCNSGYYLSTSSSYYYQCRYKYCYCDDGTRAHGSSCPQDGYHRCTSCDSGYYLSTSSSYYKQCRYKYCYCDNGSRAHGSSCPTHGSHKCTSCNTKFYLSNNRCRCRNNSPEKHQCYGVATGSPCVPCATCQDVRDAYNSVGWHLDESAVAECRK